MYNVIWSVIDFMVRGMSAGGAREVARYVGGLGEGGLDPPFWGTCWEAI